MARTRRPSTIRGEREAWVLASQVEQAQADLVTVFLPRTRRGNVTASSARFASMQTAALTAISDTARDISRLFEPGNSFLSGLLSHEAAPLSTHSDNSSNREQELEKRRYLDPQDEAAKQLFRTLDRDFVRSLSKIGRATLLRSIQERGDLDGVEAIARHLALSRAQPLTNMVHVSADEKLFEDGIRKVVGHPALLPTFGLVADFSLSGSDFQSMSNATALSVTLEDPDRILQEEGITSQSWITRIDPATHLPARANGDAVCDAIGRLVVRDGAAYRFKIVSLNERVATEQVIDVAKRGNLNDLAVVNSAFASRGSLKAEHVQALYVTDPGSESTDGIALIAKDPVATIFNGHRANPDENKIDLYLEDLIIGWRPEIRGAKDGDIEKRPWYSIVNRNLEYPELEAILNRKDRTFTWRRNEGMVRPSMQRIEPSSMTLSAQAKLLRYTGWTLSARFLDADPEGHEPPPPGWRLLREDATVKLGSLLPLRFDHEYQLRLIGGFPDGSSLLLPDSDVNDSGQRIGVVTEAFTFRRHERIAPPEVLLDGDCEFPAIAGKSTAREHTATRILHVEGTHFFSTYRRRILVPPRISLQQAIWHGQFDKGRTPMTGAFPEAELLKDGSFPTNSSSVSNGEYVDGESVYRSRGFAPLPVYPYYPDPLARLLCVRAFTRDEAATVAEVVVPFYPDGKDWPDAQPIVLELGPVRAGDRGVMVEQLRGFQKSTVIVRVPEGSEVIVELSCSAERLYGTESFGTLHAVNRVVDRLDVLSQATDQDEQRRLFGENEAVCPARVVRLTHVAKRLNGEVLAPSFGKLQSARIPTWDSLPALTRAKGATVQPLEATVSIDDHEVGSLRLMASWEEVSMDAKSGRRVRQSAPTQILSVPVPSPVAKHLPRADVLAGWKVVAESMRKDLILTCGHEFGDTKHRRVTYWVEAHGRFSELATTDEAGLVRRSEAKIYHVLCSAKPEPPVLDCIVPTFEYQTTSTRTNRGEVSCRSRRLSGVRLYLGQSWGQSGDDEQLAVLLMSRPAGNFHELKKLYGGYASYWGNDPIWVDYISHELLTQREFEKTARVERWSAQMFEGAPIAAGDFDLLLPSIQTDEVVGQYFVDIPVISPDGAPPFVQFAIAKLQPYADEKQFLSTPAFADMMQLQSGRLLTIRYLPDDGMTVEIAVTGLIEDDGNRSASCSPPTCGPSLMSRITVRLECASPLLDMLIRDRSEWLWDTAVDASGNEIDHVYPVTESELRTRFALGTPSVTQKFRIVVIEENVERRNANVAATSEDGVYSLPRRTYFDEVFLGQLAWI